MRFTDDTASYWSATTCAQNPVMASIAALSASAHPVMGTIVAFNVKVYSNDCIIAAVLAQFCSLDAVYYLFNETIYMFIISVIRRKFLRLKTKIHSLY